MKKLYELAAEENTDITADLFTQTSDEGEIQQTITEPYVTPEMFGAAGDGITDDSQALQNMFNAGKLCLLPNKTYAVHGVKVGSNAKIIGDHTIFLYNNLAASIPDSLDSYIIYNTDSVNGSIYIHGVTFDGQNDNVPNPSSYHTIMGSTVVLSNYDSVKFDSCSFKKSVMDGVFLTNCVNVDFRGCTFDQNGKRESSGTFNALTCYGSAGKININSCNFSNCNDEAIRADDFDLLCVENCSFTNMGQYILEPVYENISESRINFVNNFVDNTGGTCISIRPFDATKVALLISGNTFTDIGGFTQFHPNENNIGILEISGTSDAEENVVWVLNNNISINSGSCRHVIYAQRSERLYVENNEITVLQSPGARSMISINGTKSLAIKDNIFTCEYAQSYTDKNFVLNLFNAKADFTGVLDGNILKNLKHLAKMPLSADSVGVINSLTVINNIAHDAETLINLQNKVAKIETVRLIGNECPVLAELYQKGVEDFIAVGNSCTTTIQIGKSIVNQIYEAANTNASVQTV